MRLRDILTFLISVALLLSCSKDKKSLPEVETSTITEITHNSAVSGGDIKSDGGSNIIARGVCWSTISNPAITDNHTSNGNSTGLFVSNISALQPNTQYYLRAYATNGVGTAYGQNLSFKTLEDNIVLDDIEDVEGNKYKVVKIGDQTWMAENLRVTKYSNGDPIPNIAGEEWDNLTSGAYCFYENNSSNINTYGMLYNWFAAVDTRNICPEGWHLPSMDEWQTLSDSGMELKEAGHMHWAVPNNCFQNNSGFRALPGGNCGFDGNYNGLTESGYWWTSDEESEQNAWITIMDNQNMGLSGWVNADKWVGGSIRCVKD